MKANKFQLIAVAALALTLSACGDQFLDRNPAGTSILEDQYAQLANNLEGSMRGIYSLQYTYSAHDEFGRRSIDMYSDLLSGDMALTNYNYGWFYTDEQRRSVSGRSSYLWSYYYYMLVNINKVIYQVTQKSTIVSDVAKYGLPNVGLNVLDSDGNILHTYTETEATMANYYAQALTMRGWCYYELVQFFNPTTAEILSAGYQLNQYASMPIYTETNMETAQPLSSVADVYTRLEADLETAIDYFDTFGLFFDRATKLEVDADIARAILAYSFLNKANPNAATSEPNKTYYQNAVTLCSQIGTLNTYYVLPAKELITNGFNNVNSVNWMWGQDVTVETATGLGSFFGQVDIHSYSYAWAGDTKAIDQILYDSIHVWDGRKYWFNPGVLNSTFKLCPDGKFFSAKSPYSTAADDIDREWLSDNVFMRYEMVLLVAAEASYRLQDYTSARNYLNMLTDERVSIFDATAAADYASYQTNLSDADLLKEIYYNWRVEMWGEGYGLQTFRRLGPSCEKDGKRRRGGNHSSDAGSEVEANDALHTFQMPSSESTYNPAITENQ